MNKKDIIPYQNKEELAEFLNQPQIKIAEMITGAFAIGKSGTVQVGGRLIQGAMKGNFAKQVGREIQFLIKSGRIEEDYMNRRYAFQTLGELLSFIDSEAPNEDRFKAVKALFYSIIDKESSGEEIARYQLFRISQKLNSSQLLTLKGANALKKKGEAPSSASTWRLSVAREVGHNLTGLIMSSEETLIKEGLIGETTHADKSGIKNYENSRLTDLGTKLIELIIEYEDFAEEKINN